MNSKCLLILIHWLKWHKTSFERVNISMDFGLDIFMLRTWEGQKGHIIFWTISFKIDHCAMLPSVWAAASEASE